MPRASEKVGKKFGRWLVLRTIQRNSRTFYECRCECGTVRVTPLNNTRSCGCYQRQSVAERSRKELGFASKRAVYSYYRRNAVSRDLEWNITWEEFQEIISKDCFYCGVKAEDLWTTPEGDSFVKTGIDRIDNEKGYVSGNYVPCCKICNRAKGALPVETFRKWIERIRGFAL